MSLTALLKRKQRSSLGIWSKVEGGGLAGTKVSAKAGLNLNILISFHFPFSAPYNMQHRHFETGFGERTGSTGWHCRFWNRAETYRTGEKGIWTLSWKSNFGEDHINDCRVTQLKIKAIDGEGIGFKLPFHYMDSECVMGMHNRVHPMPCRECPRVGKGILDTWSGEEINRDWTGQKCRGQGGNLGIGLTTESRDYQRYKTQGLQ